MPPGPVPPEGGEEAAGNAGAPAVGPGARGGALSVPVPPAASGPDIPDPPSSPSSFPAAPRAARSPVERLAGILRVLDALDPSAADAVRGLVPRADGTLGPSLALFLALGASGLRGWAGDAFRELDLLDGGEAVDAADAGFAARPVRVDGALWSLRSVPLLVGGDRIEGIAWAVRADRPAGAASFVAQLRLETLGPVQVEGTVLPEEPGAAGRLDTVVRVAGRLDAEEAAGLRRAYAGLIEDHGLVGRLRIAPLAGAWMELEDALHADREL